MNRSTLKVKLDESEGEPFETYMGIMQGNFLSTVLFIFCIAECTDEQNEYTKELKLYNNIQFNVDPQYAKDTTFGGTNEE